MINYKIEKDGLNNRPYKSRGEILDREIKLHEIKLRSTTDPVKKQQIRKKIESLRATRESVDKVAGYKTAAVFRN